MIGYQYSSRPTDAEDRQRETRPAALILGMISTRYLAYVNFNLLVCGMVVPVDTSAVPLTLERVTAPIQPAVSTLSRPWDAEITTSPADLIWAAEEYNPPIFTKHSSPLASMSTSAPLISVAKTYNKDPYQVQCSR